MRRLFRLLANVLCLLSLAASAAAVALWVRSYRVAEAWHFAPSAAPAADAAPLPGKPEGWVYQYHLGCGGGRVQLVRRNLATSDVTPPGRRRVEPVAQALIDLEPGGNAGGSGWRFAGFEYYHSDRRFISSPTMQAWIWGFHVVGAPLWALAAGFAAPPVVWLLRRRTARSRTARGLCAGCGYDLRASREFGRCPECGRATGTEATSG
jgi:hypothetical protein